jgi:hypothetical protein
MNSNDPRAAGAAGNASTVANPGKPKSSGYAEPRPKDTSEPAKPNPDAAGDEASQVAAPRSGESVEYPSETSDDESAVHATGGTNEDIEYPSRSAPLDGL